MNAIDVLIIAGVFRGEEGTSITLHRIKKEERSNLVHTYPATGPEVERLSDMYLPEREPPQCPPSALPPDGNLTLSCVLDESVGNGNRGVVLRTRLQQVRGPHEAGVSTGAELDRDGCRLPQLMLKMGRQRCANIAREAWFYEDMELLQGVAALRCYSLFSAKIPAAQQSLLRPWNHESASAADCMPSLNWRDPLLDSRLRALLSEHKTLYVLVLEKLGGKLPINDPMSDDLTNEVKYLYHELTYLGILNYEQIRWYNILRAPDSDPQVGGIASLPLPYTSKVYGWLIDFEMAEKTNFKQHKIDEQHLNTLEELLEGLPNGVIFEIPDIARWG